MLDHIPFDNGDDLAIGSTAMIQVKNDRALTTTSLSTMVGMENHSCLQVAECHSLALWASNPIKRNKPY